MYQLVAIHTENPGTWPKNWQKHDTYINAEGIHELLGSSQQSLQKTFAEQMGITVIEYQYVLKAEGTIYTYLQQ